MPDLVEYIVEPLLAGLRDNSSYVRRCAVMGCVKLYHLIPDFVEGKKSTIILCCLYIFLIPLFYATIRCPKQKKGFFTDHNDLSMVIC